MKIKRALPYIVIGFVVLGLGLLFFDMSHNFFHALAFADAEYFKTTFMRIITLDWILKDGMAIHQIAMPIYAGISALFFYRYLHTILPLEMYRSREPYRFALHKMVAYSFKMAITIFVSFAIFYFIGFFFPAREEFPREFMEEILGRGFSENHQRLYYLIYGILTCFIVPFMYSLFACAMSLKVNRRYKAFLNPLLYFYILTIFLSNLSNSSLGSVKFRGIIRSLAPAALTAPGAFYDISSFIILLGFIPLIAVIIGCFKSWRHHEKELI